ncbi:MAG: hypothetical protein R3275_00385 [Saprospiraceae bacterium]|nr:hypothetical protein [Saprospiraceae bacterium]
MTNHTMLFFSPIVLILMLSCATFQTLPSDYEGDMIEFGHGGGFAGIEYSHILLDNGDVFKEQSNESYKPHKRLDDDAVTQIFNNAKLLNLASLEYMKPGNTYRFIEVRIDGKSNRLSWNDVGDSVPPTFAKFYRILKEHLE